MPVPAAWYPRAVRRPVPNTASPHAGEGKYLYEVAGTFTRPPLGWILHVVVGDGSPYRTFLTAKSPTRRFSHLWFAKDGSVEQYGPFDHKSWAQGPGGNGTYLSCETEGVPTEPLTGAQIQALAAFHAWAGFPDRIADTPGEAGIGVHYMGGADWGGHTCPDPDPPGRGPRSRQRVAILTAAKAIRNPRPPVTPEDDMTPTEVAKAVLGAAFKEYVDQNHNGARDSRTVADIIYSGHAAAVTAEDNAARALAAVEALTAKVDTLLAAVQAEAPPSDH